MPCERLYDLQLRRMDSLKKHLSQILFHQESPWDRLPAILIDVVGASLSSCWCGIKINKLKRIIAIDFLRSCSVIDSRLIDLTSPVASSGRERRIRDQEADEVFKLPILESICIK